MDFSICNNPQFFICGDCTGPLVPSLGKKTRRLELIFKFNLVEIPIEKKVPGLEKR